MRSSLSHKLSEKNQTSRCLRPNANTLQLKALSRLSTEMYLSREPCSTHFLQGSSNATSATQLRPKGIGKGWNAHALHGHGAYRTMEAVSKSIAQAGSWKNRRKALSLHVPQSLKESGWAAEQKSSEVSLPTPLSSEVLKCSLEHGPCLLRLLSLKVLQVDGTSWCLHSLQPGRTPRCWKHLLEDVDRQIHGEVGVEGRTLWAEG